MLRVEVGLSLSALLALSLFGCGAGPDPSAIRNRTFYEYGRLGGGASLEDFERPYPPLNNGELIGVQVFDGAVRFSRPGSWMIRSASNEPAKRYIEYVSPSAVIFAIYERVESPRDVWRDVMVRYEAEVQSSGGKVTTKPIPVATWNAQGRAYVVERAVAAPKNAFVNQSREYLLRSDHRVLLVQFLNQSGEYERSGAELLPVLKSMQVL